MKTRQRRANYSSQKYTIKAAKDKMEKENLIIGRNTVKEAIKSGRDIDFIMVQSGSDDRSIKDISAMAKKNGIAIKQVPKTKLDEKSMPYGYGGKPANHQGIAAQIPSAKYSDIEDAFNLASQRNEPIFLIALDGISDPHNFGAIIRSAEALGAHGVITLKRKSASLTAAACKTACGAEEFIPVIKVNNLSQTIDQLKQRGVWVACADMDGDDATFTDLKGPLMIVIGAEGEGVSRLVKEKSDFVIKIGLKGNIQSLNASAAAAILMYERERQLLAAQNKK